MATYKQWGWPQINKEYMSTYLARIRTRSGDGGGCCALNSWDHFRLALKVTSNNPVTREPDLSQPLEASSGHLHLTEFFQQYWLSLNQSGVNMINPLKSMLI